MSSESISPAVTSNHASIDRRSKPKSAINSLAKRLTTDEGKQHIRVEEITDGGWHQSISFNAASIFFIRFVAGTFANDRSNAFLMLLLTYYFFQVKSDRIRFRYGFKETILISPRALLHQRRSEAIFRRGDILHFPESRDIFSNKISEVKNLSFGQDSTDLVSMLQLYCKGFVLASNHVGVQRHVSAEAQGVLCDSLEAARR